MDLKEFIKECHEKEVFKKISIYIVTSWLLIQVLSSIYEPLGLPQETVTFLIIILLIGFPVNIFLVWKFHLSDLENLKPKHDKNGNIIPCKYKKSPFKKTYFYSLTIISLIAFFSVLLIINNKFIQDVNLPNIESSDKIAILKFGNDTRDEQNDIIGKMAVDWISHGITENKVAQVVSPEIVDEYERVLMASVAGEVHVDVLKDYLRPKNIISGNYFLKDDKLLFQCSIMDGELHKTFISFKPVECDASDPMDCIESLKQLILGYLSTVERGVLNLQELPPKFEAYQLVLEAEDNPQDGKTYLTKLNKAIEIDSNYFYPKILRVGYYYNEEQFKKADSVLRLIKPFSEKQQRQQNLINLYDAVLKGQNDKVAEYLKTEYNFTPFDLNTNYSLMVVQHQFVNRPQDVDTVFNAISEFGLNVKDCIECEYRVYIDALADIELKKYPDAIEMLTEVNKGLDSFYLKETLIRAYVRSGEQQGVQEVLEKLDLKPDKDNLRKAYFYAGKEFLLLNEKEKANDYFQKAISSIKDGEVSEIYASLLYFMEDYVAAEKILYLLYNSDPHNENLLAKLAVTYHKNGKEKEATKLITELQALYGDYQFGKIDYSLAQFYAAINDEEKSMKYLLNAVAQGFRFRSDKYQNDPHFLAYKDSEKFKNILNYWHY